MAITLLAAVVLGACGGTDTAQQPSEGAQKDPAETSAATVTITTDDGSIEMPATVRSDPTTFVLENDGTRAYEAKFARLNEGVSVKDLKASLRTGPDAVFSLITLAGELRRTGPGGNETQNMQLATGNYVVVDPKYATQGMVHAFEVVAGTHDTDEPPSDVEVTLDDMSIDMPATLPSGLLTFKIGNHGTQAHEIVLLREGEKPARETPGATPFNPGSIVWSDFELEPGRYTAVCYFPDAQTGKPHAALGMKTKFIVE
jgi:hypothetical protein